MKDNDDPKKLGRVKCYIKTIFEGNSDNFPWCFPRSNAGFGGAPDSSGLEVPEIGNELILTFPKNDVYFQVYVGYWQSEKTHQGLLFDDDYPDSYGQVNSFVSWVRGNKATGAIEYFNKLGSLIQIDEDGNLRISVPGDIVWTVDGDIIQQATGDHVSIGRRVLHNPLIAVFDQTIDLQAYVATLEQLAATIKDQAEAIRQQNLSDTEV